MLWFGTIAQSCKFASHPCMQNFASYNPASCCFWYSFSSNYATSKLSVCFTQILLRAVQNQKIWFPWIVPSICIWTITYELRMTNHEFKKNQTRSKGYYVSYRKWSECRSDCRWKGDWDVYGYDSTRMIGDGYEMWKYWSCNYSLYYEAWMTDSWSNGCFDEQKKRAFGNLLNLSGYERYYCMSRTSWSPMWNYHGYVYQ